MLAHGLREKEASGGQTSVSRKKRRIAATDRTLLVSSLRGEVGEIITTWTVMGHLIDESRCLKSGDLAKDVWNRALAFNRWLTDKMRDEIISRLSELGYRKAGRINFFSVATELNQFEKETAAFSAFMKKNNFLRRRNAQISHKEIPACWNKLFDFRVSYMRLLRGLAFALVLMKKIDRVILGPAAPYLWREARKKRYQPIYPAHISYNLLPYLFLQGADRIKICLQELQEDASNLEEISTTINGKPDRIRACKKWGVIFLGRRALALPNYPLQEIGEIMIDLGNEQAKNKK